MKKLACLLISISTLFGVVLAQTAQPVEAHHIPGAPLQGTILPGQVNWGVFDEVLPTLAPEYATNCTATIRSSRTSAVGICYNWSGSGNYKYQVAALAFDGCNRWIWMYGNVGYPYIRGKTTTGKWSYVYTPPGWFWRFVMAKVIAWKP